MRQNSDVQLMITKLKVGFKGQLVLILLVSLWRTLYWGLWSTSELSRRDMDSQEWGQILARTCLSRDKLILQPSQSNYITCPSLHPDQ